MLRSTLQPPASSTTVVARALSLACAIAVLVIALAGNRFGYSHGFDHWIPEGIEYENTKVAAAISDLLYDTNKGRVADTRVYNALRKGGVAYYAEFTEPLGVKHPQ